MAHDTRQMLDRLILASGLFSQICHDTFTTSLIQFRTHRQTSYECLAWYHVTLISRTDGDNACRWQRINVNANIIVIR